MMIDFHTHVFPETIAARAIDKLSAASGTPPYADGTEAGLLRSMRKAGIGRAVLLPVATRAESCAHINDALLAAPQTDALIRFGAMHPDCGSWRAELERLKARGIRGIKLHPVYQDVEFDDLRFLRILDRAGELGLLVVTHAGDDIGFPGVTRCEPERIASALRQVGPVRLIAAHMGGWQNWERAGELAQFPNVSVDTSFSLGTLETTRGGRFQGRAQALLDEERFVSLVRCFGASRVLFGTDSPWSDQADSLARIRALPLQDDELQAILGLNAARLLGKEEPDVSENGCQHPAV